MVLARRPREGGRDGCEQPETFFALSVYAPLAGRVAPVLDGRKWGLFGPLLGCGGIQTLYRLVLPPILILEQ